MKQIKLLERSVLILLVLVCTVHFRAYAGTADSSAIKFCGTGDVGFGHSSLTAFRLRADQFPGYATQTCGAFKLYFEDMLTSQPSQSGFADPTVGAARRATFCAALMYIQSIFNFNNISGNDPIRIYVYRSYQYPADTAPAGTPWLAFAEPNIDTFHQGVTDGYLHDYTLSGVDGLSDTAYHGAIMMNFNMAYNVLPGGGSYPLYVGGATVNMPIWNDVTLPFTPQNGANDSYDLYSILIHEMFHNMGWFTVSAVSAHGAQPYSRLVNTNPYVFSSLDTSLWAGTVSPTSGPATRMIINPATTTPGLNPSRPAVSENYWMNFSAAPENHPVYSGDYKGGGSESSFLMHLDAQLLQYANRGRISPGDAMPYVMGANMFMGVLRRVYTKEEIQFMYKTLHYPLVANASNLNMVYNHIPYCARMAGYSISDYYTTNPETLTPDVTITNDVGVQPVTIDVNDSRWGFTDADHDSIFVYPGSLSNLRGCGINGNNHNMLSFPNAHTIVFHPKPNFYGKAQFCFNLWDRKDKGSFVVMTIEVKRGSNVSNPLFTNMVINGNMEEGSEIKRYATDESVAYTTYDEGGFTGGKWGYIHFSDGHPYGHLSNDRVYLTGNGTFISRGYQYSADVGVLPAYAFSTHLPYPFGSVDNTSGVQYAGVYVPSPDVNRGERFQRMKASPGYGSFYNLSSDVTKCHWYKLAFDVQSDNPTGYALFPIAVAFLDTTITYPDIVNDPIGNSKFSFVTSTSSLPGVWVRDSIYFQYCSDSAHIMYLHSGSITNDMFIDNISLTQQPDTPSVLISNITETLSSTCVPSLIANVSNPKCQLTYRWTHSGSTVGTSDTLVLAPGAVGQYFVNISDGCRSTIDSIDLNAYPFLTTASPDTICSGMTTTLSAGTSGNNIWSPSITCGGACLTGTVSPAATTTYTVTNTNLNGCTTSGQVTVHVNSVTASITASANPACVGIGETLFASPVSGLFQYQWFNASGPISGEISDYYYPSIYLTGTHTYRCLVYAVGYCSDTAYFTLTTGQAPNPSVLYTSSSICEGNRDSLYVNTPLTYQYQWYLDSGSSVINTGPYYNAAPAGSGTYSYRVRVTDTNGCSVLGYLTDITVLANPAPAIIPQSYSTLCPGQSVTLNVDPTLTSVWFLNGSAIGVTASSYTSAPTAPGTYNYTVVSTNSNGCSVSSSITTVIMDSATAPTLSPSSAITACGRQVLTAGPTGIGYLYQWQKNGSNIDSNTAAFTDTVTANGSYSVILTNPLGCKDTSSAVSITINTLPSSTITPTGNQTSCSSVKLTANTGSGLSYQWQRNDTAITGATYDTLMITTTGAYSVIVTGSNGCSKLSGHDTITIAPIPALPSISPSSATSICFGSTQTFFSGSVSGLSYQWQNNGSNISGATGTSISASTAGSYRVMVTNVYGCKDSSATIGLTLVGPPTATITAAATTICPASIVRLSANTGTGYTYQWKLNGSNISGATGATYNVTSAGRYMVVISANGCSTPSATDTLSSGNVYSGLVGAGHSTRALCSGSPDSMYTLTGTGYTYQWYRNGNLTTDTTSIYPFTAVNGDSFRVVVSMPGYCPATSADVIISLTTDPCATCMLWGSNAYTPYTGNTISTTMTGNYYIDHSVTVSGNVSLHNAVIQMSQYATITVPPGASLTVDGSHLFACGTHMWGGIRASGGGTVTVQNNALIEDADTAVAIIGTSTLTSSNTIFNKNLVGVFVAGVSNPTSTLSVSNTIFTSRNIKGGYSYPVTWPAVSVFKSHVPISTTYPYESISYGSVACNSGQAAQAGISLLALGTTDISAYPFTYAQATVGSTTAASQANFFDNLVYGINAYNANVTSLNNWYLNCTNGIYFDEMLPADHFYGLRLWNNGTGLNNRFYDCVNGVEVANGFSVDAENTYMISNHTTSSPGTGIFGYLVKGGGYHNVDILADTLINVTTGISVAIPAYFWQTGSVLLGPMGPLTDPAYNNDLGAHVKYNEIKAIDADASIGGQFVRLGISLQSAMSRFLPVTGAHVDSNHLHDVYNGVLVNGLESGATMVTDNYIGMRLDNTTYGTPNYQQFGVHFAYSNGAVNENDIVGTYNPAVDYWRGMYMDNNWGVTVNCNNTDGLSRDVEFVNHQNAVWRSNKMNNSRYGFVLNGRIGAQGGSVNPMGNIWAGTWAGTNYQTFTIDPTLPTSSILYCDASSVPTNNNNSRGLLIHTYGLNTSIFTTTGGTPPPCYSPFAGRQPIHNLENIATNNITFGSNEGINEWTLQLKLYQNILMDSSLLDSSSILSEFYSYAQYSRYKYVTDIGDLLAQGNVSDAQAELWGGWSATPALDETTNVQVNDSAVDDGIVHNYESYYFTYINFLNNNMTSSDSANVIMIANLCPRTDGAVVYQARALYNILHDDPKIFFDGNCNGEHEVGGHGKQANPAQQNGDAGPGLQNMSLQPQSYRLYPNPTSGLLHIMQNMPDKNMVNAEVWNGIGESIYKGKLAFNNGMAMINMEQLAPGHYLLHLTDEKGKSYTLRFVVNYN